MRVAVVPLLFAAASLLAAPVPKELRKPKSDLAVLQGEWVITESVINGRPMPQAHGIRYVVKGNAIRIHRPESDSDSTITLNEKDKTYHWQTVWDVWVGRYRIDGDKLTMAGRRGTEIPPTVEPGPTHEYDVHTREK